VGPRVSKLDNLAAFRWFFASLGRHNTDQTKSWHEFKSAPIYAEVYTVGHADFGRCSRFLIKQSIAGVFAYSVYLYSPLSILSFRLSLLARYFWS